MVHAVIYGMRGWIAFVAFIEFSNAIRCFFDERQFLNNLLPPSGTIESPVMARLFGRYFLLNGVIMTHCALFIHHMPVISLSICCLGLSLVFYLSEAFYYYNFLLSFYIIFPTIISFFTLTCLLVAPFFIEEEPKRRRLSYYEEECQEDEDDYETKLIKRNVRPGRPSSSSSGKVKLQ